jgi:hypothetical protein
VGREAGITGHGTSRATQGYWKQVHLAGTQDGTQGGTTGNSFSLFLLPSKNKGKLKTAKSRV